jgi:undecaprenyl-diphosphatase
MFFNAISLWERLEHWDQQAFTVINSGLTNPLFDAVMPYLRSGMFWAPLYLFALVFVILNYKIQGLWWSLFLISTVALADLTGNYAFKHVFERSRPCNDPDFASQVRLLLEHCGSGYSFTSNHAANHFGMATFFFITFRPVFKNWVWIAIIWAFLVGYAQVYVGVHYPLDVLTGALMGIGWGYLMGAAFNKRFGFTTFGNQPVA